MEKVRIKAHYVTKYVPRSFSVKFSMRTSIKMYNLQNFKNYQVFLTHEEYNIFSSFMEKKKDKSSLSNEICT